eukprot:NODE_5196_length_706_cov_42.611872_g4828_i0.p1 GENE.NODE_5196_length_706_cov_42.611872_g4828_i0~~NODE_5196_length_706_cov_42.611872_g4828_i0.p1  ORF type:complete len:217 (+),score=32.61 NODE_5196_length_706_cov_42.611872_g4828_i0:53-703(+)
MAVLLFFTAFSSLVPLSRAAHFHLQDSVKRCVVQELAPSEVVVVHYHCPSLDLSKRPKAEPMGLNVGVNDPEGFSIFKTHLHQEDDVFEFTSLDMGGMHEICFKTNASHARDEHVKLSLEITGSSGTTSSVSLEGGTTLENIESISQRVAVMESLIREIRHEMDYTKLREARFRQTSDSTYRRVWASAIVTVLLAAGLTAFQMHALRKFFVQKKLV